MPTFIYKAKDKSGKIVEGSIIADESDVIVDRLDKMGCFPILIKEEGEVKESVERLFSFQRISKKEVIVWTRQLADLLEGGLSLNQALHLQVQNSQFKGIIKQISKDVAEGVKFSQALTKYPEIFPSSLVSMVKAGEVGGKMSEVLDKACEYLERIDELKTKVTTALTYPAFLVSVGIITITFLMIFVIPKLVTMFQDLGQNLPLPTLILIASSNFIFKYWWLIIAGLVIVIFGINRMFSIDKGRLLVDRFVLSLPLLGEIVKKVEFSKWTLNLGTLLTNGVPIMEALKVTNSGSRNLIIRSEFDRIYKEVDEGKRIAEAVSNKENFSRIMVSMLAVAEEGGFLEKALLKIASNCEKELDRIFKVLTSLLEPVVILGMGIVVGFIVIAMLLPVFRMNILVE